MANQTNSPQSGPKVLVLLLVVAIGVLYFRRSNTPPAPEPEPAPAPTISEAPAPPTPAPEPMPGPSNVNAPIVTAAPVAPAAVNVNDTFQTEFKKCFPERNLPTSLQDFVTDMMNSVDVDERDPSVENVRVRSDESGREQRLNIIPRGQNAEVRMFNVDEQGNLFPSGRVQWMTKSEAEGAKMDFLHRGKLLATVKKDSVMLTDGTRISVEWQDDHVTSAMFYRPTSNFQCTSPTQCQCHPSPK